jgi:hypothetical protein
MQYFDNLFVGYKIPLALSTGFDLLKSTVYINIQG